MHCQWQFFDIMGERPTLYYKSFPRYSSFFGFIMTFIAFALIRQSSSKVQLELGYAPYINIYIAK